MKAFVQNIDVLDVEADALIYSTNVLLNCTGGVGACLATRYGKQVQVDLHQLLEDTDSKFADQGSVFERVTMGMPYKKVFHVVPCDGFYNTTEEIVAGTLRRCLKDCVSAPDVHTVALSALATGYGRLGFEDFFRISSGVLKQSEFESLERVTIGVYEEHSFGMVCKQITDEQLALTPA